MMRGLRWVFRGKANFALTVVGVSFIGLTGINFVRHNQFLHPVVDESTALLSRNTELKRTLGFPIVYQQSSNSETVERDGELFFAFEVHAPRGNVSTEVIANSKPLNKVYNPESVERLNKQIAQTNNKITEKTNLLNDLKTRLSNSKKGQGRQQLETEANMLGIELDNLGQELRNLETQRINTLKNNRNKYYIPDKKHIEDLNSHQFDTSEVPENWTMWGISSLEVEMPNRNRIIVIPATESLSALELPLDKKWTYKSLYNKLNEISLHLAPQQLESYSVHKRNTMYQKQGQYRMLMLVVAMVGIGSFVFFLTRNSIASMHKSAFIMEMRTLFYGHPEIKKLGELRWNEVLKGGKRGDNVDIEVQVFGQNQAKHSLILKAKYDEKNNKYDSQKIDFIFNEEPGKSKIIDLLKH